MSRNKGRRRGDKVTLVADGRIVQAVTQLGFSQEQARCAAIATRNAGTDQAAEWLFSREQSAALVRKIERPTTNPPVDPADTLCKLCEMGFSQSEAANALASAGGPGLMPALDWLKSHKRGLESKRPGRPALVVDAKPDAKPSTPHLALASGGPDTRESKRALAARVDFRKLQPQNEGDEMVDLARKCEGILKPERASEPEAVTRPELPLPRLCGEALGGAETGRGKQPEGRERSSAEGSGKGGDSPDDRDLAYLVEIFSGLLPNPVITDVWREMRPELTLALDQIARLLQGTDKVAASASPTEMASDELLAKAMQEQLYSEDPFAPGGGGKGRGRRNSKAKSPRRRPKGKKMALGQFNRAGPRKSKWDKSSAKARNFDHGLRELTHFRQLREAFPDMHDENELHATYMISGNNLQVCMALLREKYRMTELAANALALMQTGAYKGTRVPLPGWGRGGSESKQRILVQAERRLVPGASPSRNAERSARGELIRKCILSVSADQGERSAVPASSEVYRRHREGATRITSEWKEKLRRVKASGSSSASRAHAGILAKKASQVAMEMRREHLKAATQIFREMNTSGKDIKYRADLHGLHASEAVEFSEELLAIARERGRTQYVLITGVGNRQGGGTIKPALLRWLGSAKNQALFACGKDTNGPGTIKVKFII